MNNFNKKINSIKEKFSNGNNLNFFLLATMIWDFGNFHVNARPVLKHGPRRPTQMRVQCYFNNINFLGIMKVIIYEKLLNKKKIITS